MIPKFTSFIVMLSFFLVGCKPAEPQINASPFLVLSSTAFGNGDALPVQFTCAGENISPPLQWNEPPSGTQSFAMIMDDPDAIAGTWVHWVIVHIPADMRSLPQNLQPSANSVIVGENSWGNSAYGGPCPPSGTHHYYFKLYALNIVLPLNTGADKSQVLTAMEGHVLASGELVGLAASK